MKEVKIVKEVKNSNMINWKISVLSNGLFECICPKCGNRKEVLNIIKPFSRCHSCGLILKSIKPTQAKKRLISGVKIRNEKNRRV